MTFYAKEYQDEARGVEAKPQHSLRNFQKKYITRKIDCKVMHE